MSEISKDINSIWTRLFDHRAFLNGEIQFTLREFELKRSDQEVESLFSALENITDIKDTQIDRIKQTASAAFPSISESLDRALSVCAEIAATEQTYKQNTLLEKEREKRKKEFGCFMDVMTDTCKSIDNTFDQKEEELQEFYTDLEHKLKLTK